MFELKRGTTNLQGTCYFEFVKNSDKLKTCWNENAYYLEDWFFSFYYSTFKEASNRFDRYYFNKFSQSEIQRLIAGLSLLLSELKSINDEETFKKSFEKIYFYFERDGKLENWKEYIEIFKTNTLLIQKLANECLEEKQVFGVLGI